MSRKLTKLMLVAVLTAVLFALVVLQALTDEKNAAKVARGMVTDVLD